MSVRFARRVQLGVVLALVVLGPLTGCGRARQEAATPEAATAKPSAAEPVQSDAPAPTGEPTEAQDGAQADDTGAEPADAATAETIPPDREQGPSFGARLWNIVKIVFIFVGKLLFVLSLPLAVAATLFGLPGGVLVLSAATVYSALHGWASPPWWSLIVLALIALAAELAENALSFLGVKRSGASNATGMWVLAGGFIGAVAGGLIAPVLASIGALAGPVGWIILSIIPPIGLGMLGGYLGGYQYELRQGKSPEEARRAGWGALIGRLTGSLTKALLVAVMSTIVLIASWSTLF